MPSSHLLGVQRVAHCAHFMKKLHPGLFQHVDGFHTARLVDRRTRYFEPRDLFLGADPEIHLVMLRPHMDRRKNRHVHHEGPVGELPGLPDGVPELVFGRVVRRCEVSQSPGVRYRGAELRHAQPVHCSAYNRIIDPEHFGNLCLYHHVLPLFTVKLLIYFLTN